MFGRPPCINLAWVDCEFPKDPEEHIDADGHPEWGCTSAARPTLPPHILTVLSLTVHPWSWQYSKLLHNVRATAFAAAVPQYTKILELDRKIRDYPVPYSMRGKCGQPEAVEASKATHMRRYSCMAAKEISCVPPSACRVR